jgi:membrane dipeptidase
MFQTPLCLASLFATSFIFADPQPERFHYPSLLIDGHNDLPWRLREEKDMALEKFDLNANQSAHFHTDIPRLKKGGVGAQFWSAFVPSSTMATGNSYSMTLEQIDLIHRMVQRYPDTFEIATGTEDIRRIRRAGKIASLIGIEGGHSMEESLYKLNDLYRRGARYMTLTHWKNLSWAEAATDTEMAVGLNTFGENVIAEMNRLGMLVDISHVSPKTMRHVLRVTKAPIIASHSSARALKDHVRNVPDDVLVLVAKNGGVVMVNFYSEFLTDSSRPFAASSLLNHSHACARADIQDWTRVGRSPNATVATVVNHIDHIVKTAGIDHVGLGSDFDGVPLLPDGLEDVSKYPAITAELLKRGYSEEHIRKILGENLMRAFRQVEEFASRQRMRASK